MLRDETVFVMGEEVARYNGAYKVTKGLLDKFGEDRVIDVSQAIRLSCRLSLTSRPPLPSRALPVWLLAPPSPVCALCASSVSHLHLHTTSAPRQLLTSVTWNFAMQAIDQIVNSAGKTYYMSGGNVPCPVTFRGPNGAAAGVAAQHSQVSYPPNFLPFPLPLPPAFSPALPLACWGLLLTRIVTLLGTRQYLGSK